MAAKDDGVAAGVPANVLLLISEPKSDYERARRDQVAANFNEMASMNIKTYGDESLNAADARAKGLAALAAYRAKKRVVAERRKETRKAHQNKLDKPAANKSDIKLRKSTKAARAVVPAKKRPSPQPKRAAPKKKKKTTTTTTTDEKGKDRPDRRTEKYRASRRVPATNPRARGPIRNWPIDAGVTKEFIPKLQKYLKEHPDGGDAMAKKVAGWGAYVNGHGCKCYVDPDLRKMYQTRPKIVRALKAEASA